MSFIKTQRQGYCIEIEEPSLYVDNKSRGRSGHMSHAMAEFSPGCFIDFNSNCSALRYGGHFPYGWVEYRISKDYGKTYSDFKRLEYSYQSFTDGIHAISVEKAVATDDGTIVAFCLRNDALSPQYCEPWSTPVVIRSYDGAESWTEPEVFSEYAGRTYDALYHDGDIYVLHFCNENFLGTTDEHKYRIYKSEDNGKTFKEHCVVPIDGIGRGYGAMIFAPDGTLHVYAYNSTDEERIDHVSSSDNGITWEINEPCFLKYGVRNPQVAILDGVFILHGRTKDRDGFVLYTSENGSEWDEGVLIEKVNYIAGAYYSNNINLKDEKGNFLLVQYSSPYTDKENPHYVATVNVKHLKLRINRI